MSFIVSSLGFPRIGPDRELKMVLECFWLGKADGQALLKAAAALRAASRAA